MPNAKIAGAPITWGISEVPGWGHQLTTERVLDEMRGIGLAATELGPDGFLPDAPEEKARLLERFDLAAVGSFLPVVLFDDALDPLPRIRRELDAYVATGATTLVLAAVSGDVGYDTRRPGLDAAEWKTLFRNLDRAAAEAAERGIVAVLHPHAGTMVESADEVQRVLDSTSFPFCFDTGHLMIGGTDPVRFARDHAARIAHTHLKDVTLDGIELVTSGEMTYLEAVTAERLYRPLGHGDVDIRSIIGSLAGAGYDGWFVLEQDKVLPDEPAPGRGPVEDAATSADFVRSVVAEVTDTAEPALRRAEAAG